MLDLAKCQRYMFKIFFKLLHRHFNAVHKMSLVHSQRVFFVQHAIPSFHANPAHVQTGRRVSMETKKTKTEPTAVRGSWHGSFRRSLGGSLGRNPCWYGKHIHPGDCSCCRIKAES